MQIDERQLAHVVSQLALAVDEATVLLGKITEVYESVAGVQSRLSERLIELSRLLEEAERR